MTKRRVYAYIDGSNFYHLSKLNFGISKVEYHHFVNQLVRFNDEELIRIRYFVAPVNQQECPKLYINQQKFFSHLKKTPLLDIMLGKLVSRPLNKIKISCPDCGDQLSEELKCPLCDNKIKLKDIFKTSEKGVDVNLSINLLLDALKDKYDKAFLFSGDADFCPAINYIIKFLKKEVVFCSFPKPKTNELVQCCSETRIITRKIIENSKINSNSSK